MADLSDLVPFHSGQVENFYLLVLDKYKCIKLIQFCISYLINNNQLTSCIKNSVDPDQQEKPADQDPCCLQELIYIWFHTVFERIKQ